jgi:uncharacterized protein
VRVFTEHTNRTGGEPLWELLDPEIEWIVDPTALLAGTFRGHEGVKEFFEHLRESFDEIHIELDELIDAGDSVVLLARNRNRGRSSGLTVEQPTGWVIEVRGGQIVKSRLYFRPAEALEAAGLSD